MSQAELLPEVAHVSPFQFKNHPIRTQVEGETLWFVAKDVCSALGIDWSGKTLSVIPDSWQSMGKFPTLRRGEQTVKRILEPAVYKLAFRSNKPEADAFTNWIASEVVPSIRKTGKYEMQAASELITPDQQCTLQAMVRALVERGGHYAAIWSRFNNHFRIARYCQLPQSRMSEAVDYLMRFEVAPKALPGPELPVQAFRDTLPADMDPGRKDALCKIRSIMNAMLAARDVVSMFCYPEPVTMDKPRACRLTYNARHDFYAAALDCLAAAHAALEAGYKLNHLPGRG